MEFEALENAAAPGIHSGVVGQSPINEPTAPRQSAPKAPRAPRQPKPGAMTKKANVAALTGEEKPEQQEEM